MIERLIDSVIIIDHLNGIQKATDFLRTLEPAETSISVITRAEILCGIQDSDREAVLGLLDQYGLLEIDRAAADLAAALRKNFGWKLPDAFQAALAQKHKIKLTTRNTKDFNPKKHRFVEIPYTL
jgi:predicted nucleic acid-binding protein